MVNSASHMESVQDSTRRPFAVVTGASSGIGLELAKLCVSSGFDVMLGADRSLGAAAKDFEGSGVQVECAEVDLATPEGVRAVVAGVGQRPVDALIANAGHGLGKGFLEQDFDDIRHVIDTNVTGTLYLIHELARGMRDRGEGRILITGSIAGFMPGTFQAVYNATKAFIDSFALALRNELQDSGVTVTCLMPGPTDTEFFERADMMDTKVGADTRKMDAAEVAAIGFRAMMDGDADVVAGLKNKLQVAAAKVTPAEALAQQHRRMAAPGTAKRRQEKTSSVRSDRNG
jgi:uncharacterized protein